MRKAQRKGIKVSGIGGTAAGIRNAKERSVIPQQLCEYIVDICEGKIRQNPQIEWDFENEYVKIKEYDFCTIYEAEANERLKLLYERLKQYSENGS